MVRSESNAENCDSFHKLKSIQNEEELRRPRTTKEQAGRTQEPWQRKREICLKNNFVVTMLVNLAFWLISNSAKAEFLLTSHA